MAERLIEHQVTSFYGYVGAVFNLRGFVLYGPLWFLRALFACAIVAPLIGYTLLFFKGKTVMPVIGLFIICTGGFVIGQLFHLIDWVQYPSYGFVCFGVGAWIAMNGHYFNFIHKYSLLHVFLWIGSNRWTKKWLLPTGMFIYIIHLFVNRIVQYTMVRHIDGTCGCFTLIYISSLILSIVIPVIIWHIIHWTCPKILFVLDGRVRVR